MTDGEKISTNNNRVSFNLIGEKLEQSLNLWMHNSKFLNLLIHGFLAKTYPNNGFPYLSTLDVTLRDRRKWSFGDYPMHNYVQQYDSIKASNCE